MANLLLYKRLQLCLSKLQKENDPVYNRKSFMSTVLMAVVDCNKRFLWIDVGAPGGGNDSGIFKTSDLFSWLQEEGPSTLQVGEEFLLGDSCFALHLFLMKAPDDRSGDYSSHVPMVKPILAQHIHSKTYAV